MSTEKLLTQAGFELAPSGIPGLKMLAWRRRFAIKPLPPFRLWSPRNQPAISHRDVINSTQTQQTQLIYRGAL